MMRRALLAAAAALIAVPLTLAGTSSAHAADWIEIQMYNHPGWCLTVNSTNPGPGDAVYLYTCAGNINQMWQFVYNPNGTDTIRQEQFGLNGQQNCIAQDGGSGADGTALILWPCEGVNWEQFSFVPMGLPYPAGAFVNPVNSGTISLNGDVLADYTRFINWHWVWRADYQELNP